MIGVYKITNPSGRIYIGSSKNIESRKEDYMRRLPKSQPKLLNSIKKYGFDKHIFEVIEECQLIDLYEKELYYGQLYDVLSKDNLNCRLPKVGDIKTVISEETRDLYRKVQLGKKASIETKSKMSSSQKGRTHQSNTKQKMKLSSSNLKIIVCLETGIFYYGTGEAAEAKEINRSTLKNKLNGTKKNTTSLVYC